MTEYTDDNVLIRQAEGRVQRAKLTLPDPSDDDVLVTRAEARRMLGNIGRDMIFKLEAEGRLHPVKLTNSQRGHVFYGKHEVRALMMPAKPIMLRPR